MFRIDPELLGEIEHSLAHSAGTPGGQYVGFSVDAWSALLGLVRAVHRGEEVRATSSAISPPPKPTKK